jgi:hypothetical protein
LDVNELARDLQALMDGASAPSQRQPHHARLAATAYPDDPYGVYDDALLADNEETGDVHMTNSSNAAHRATRTGVQGAIVTILVAIGGVLGTLTVGTDIDWRLLTLSLGQAVLTAIISYLHKDKSAAESAD